MKKLFWIAAALPLLMVSCGDDNNEPEIIDETITVSPTEATVKCGETTKLTAASEGNVTWTSLDAAIAAVDSVGNVLGKHVGTTTVEATNEYGNKASSQITVEASNNNFTAPLTSWNSTKSAIEAAMAAWTNITLSTNDAEALTYTTNGTFPMYSYGFTNDALLSSILLVSNEQDSDLDLEGWLDERFWYLSKVDDDFYYYDAQTEADATMVIIYGYNPDMDCITVTFAPKSNTKAGFEVEKAYQAALKAARKTLKK